MVDITKILGLDEDTIFDDVKVYARSLKNNMFEQEQLNSLVNSCQEEIRQLKKQLENCYCNRTDCSSRIKDSKKYIREYKIINYIFGIIFLWFSFGIEIEIIGGEYK